MTEQERLRAGADVLDEVAHWSEQPDEPTGMYGVVSAFDLRMRAAALRTQAAVLADERRAATVQTIERLAADLDRAAQGFADRGEHKHADLWRELADRARKTASEAP